MFHVPPTEPQGHYRYDPTHLSQAGPARIFPYVGEDGVLRYIATRLRQDLLEQGKLSQPLSLLLQQIERSLHTVHEGWTQITTLLADLEIFQSGWFNVSLPPDEQFNSNFVQQRRSMGQALLAARRAAQTKSDTPLGGATLAAQQRSRFYATLEEHGRARPVITAIHKRDGGLSDREFVRQRLAGQNPMVLRRVQSPDQEHLQAWATQSSIDLVTIASRDGLFVADYPLLQHLTPADLQPGRYVGSPVALFQRGDRDLEPVLIQVEPGQVVTPDQADAWVRAKLSVQTADVTHHELIAHLCYTHLAMEAFAIATPRQLPPSHPLYQLLRPHFKFLLAINTRGNEVLLSEGAAIDRLMAPTRTASLSLINQAFRDRPFAEYSLPKNIHQRGLEAEVLPEFAYRDDALLLWDAITRYVTNFLQRYYPDDRAVQQDPYLHQWVAELGTPLQSRSRSEFPEAPTWIPQEWIEQTDLEPTLPDYPRVPGFPAEAAHLTLSGLIDIATSIIFTCGPQHAAVNFSQFDYVGYVPNAPFSLYASPTGSATLDQILPPPSQDLGQMELSFALSGIIWGQLGSNDLIEFADAVDRQILHQFQADLQAIEQTINTRNQTRLAQSGVAYPYLLPSRIPNSINI